MSKLALGTARITNERSAFVVRYMNIGSFLVGEQRFGSECAAREFCADRGLRVVR